MRWERDYAKLAGLTAEEDLKEPLFESMKKKRMPWLIVLLGLGMVVSSVVGMFEKVVTCLPIIMCFQSRSWIWQEMLEPVPGCNHPCTDG